VLVVRKPVRNLIQAANELEVTRDGLKIRAERRVEELTREASGALPAPPARPEGTKPALSRRPARSSATIFPSPTSGNTSKT
jgi:hypothetical protein